MFRNGFVRRALLPCVLAGTAATTVFVAANPAGAQVYPRVGVYWMTPTEYFNACPMGPGSGVVNYDGGAGNTANGMTLDCTRGSVSYTVS
jgi:hypothetical protein